MVAASAIAGAVASVRARIVEAAENAGRDWRTVRLVAVTKGVDVPRIAAAIAAGVTDIGENRVQEAADKRDQLHEAVMWHLVGHLQSNKAHRAAELFDAVHSLDSMRIGERLAEHRPAHLEPLAVLVEVNLTGIAGRAGVTEDGAEDLVRSIVGLPGIHLIGLMTIAAPGDDESTRAVFARLRGLRDRLEHQTGWSLPDLSMGMSSDYPIAVAEGATMVRVGTAIFGERTPVERDATMDS
jgi:pyridoxal phosphate enzyme (YggS family)